MTDTNNTIPTALTLRDTTLLDDKGVPVADLRNDRTFSADLNRAIRDRYNVHDRLVEALELQACSCYDDPVTGDTLSMCSRCAALSLAKES